MNTNPCEWYRLERALEKTLEETDISEMMTDLFLTDVKWVKTLSGNTIRKWMGYPITTQDNYEELYIYYLYRILEKHADTKIFYKLLHEKFFDEACDWMRANGYTETVARMLDENRPTRKEGSMKL